MKLVPAAVIMATAVFLGGCSTELGGFGTKQSAVEPNRIMSAPTASVESAPMSAPAGAPPAASAALQPPPKAYGATAATAGAAVTPSTNASNVPLTPPAVNAGGVAYAASNTQEQLSGAWTFAWDEGRRTCPLTLSTARGVSGLAAQADISCPSEIFMTKGWETLGPDLVLQNHVGKVTVRLQPDGPNHYVGVISDSNQQVALSR